PPPISADNCFSASSAEVAYMATGDRQGSGEQRALRDVVMETAAERGMVRENLWAMSCRAITSGNLPVGLPGGASLDDRPALASKTWRVLIGEGAAAAERGHDLSRYRWTRVITINKPAYDGWLDSVTANTMMRAQPGLGARKTKRTEVKAF